MTQSAIPYAISYENEFGCKDITSTYMRDAIKKWYELYRYKPHDPAAPHTSDPSLRLPLTITNKLSKAAFSEFSFSSENDFARRCMDALDASKMKAMQLTLVGGEAWLKPIFEADGSVSVGVIDRANALIFGRDAHGRVTDMGCIERSTQGAYYYTLLERRHLDEAGRLVIEYKLRQSADPSYVGHAVPLSTLSKYEHLLDTYTFPRPVGGIGLAWLRVPLVNDIDGTNDGVSVYSPAVGLIENIYRNEALLNGEFERGQSRVFVSDQMLLRPRENGSMSRLRDNLFVGLNRIGGENQSIDIFSPALREQSFLARKREYLRDIESVIGIKRGLLSEVEAVERTAKEITSSEGDYNLTILDLQAMWSAAVGEYLDICGALAPMYNAGPAISRDDVALDYGNGVLFDSEKTWAEYLDLVSRKMLKPEIALGWKFNMPTDTPEDLQKIRERYMPDSIDDGGDIGL